jgi:site-specific recombinase XerD
MIDHFCSEPAVFGRLRSGPRGPHIDGFAELLFQQGYSREAGAQKLRLVSRLGRWLARREIGVQLLDEQRIKEFVRAQGKRLGRRPGTRPTFTALLQYLRQAHIIAEPRIQLALSPLDRIEQDYAQFLRQDRALTPATLHNYLPAVRRFLVSRFGTGKICLRKLGPQDITGFILHDLSTFSPKRVQLMTSALRSFMGFLYQRGDLATNLAVSVPTVANWNLAPLPRFLEPAEVEKLLNVCDLPSPVGKRNRAILLLLARLGLRAGEVVQLTLEDIDWEAGELLVRGKSAREERLPLLREVGQALADYLRERPACPACRRVFLRMVAPYRGLSASSTVSSIVRRSLARAHLHPSHRGAHLLRHSLATQMLRRGASLTQIGQVLRHQRVQTTEIYAKVDLVALQALAQPWPGGVQ